MTDAPSTTPAATSGTGSRPVSPRSAERARVDAIARAAATAATGVQGVHAIGTAFARTIGSFRAGPLTTTSVPGVRVDLDGGRVAVGIGIVAAYPEPVGQVAAEVRSRVLEELRAEQDAVSVDVQVLDVHGPFDPVEPKQTLEEALEPASVRASRAAAARAAGAAERARDAAADAA
ncbi:Asp23/Gls24 family envelope stress response protein, partial [Amnibacterium kyonggiense]|uniref:Asp23/Gls24 family envelope stress response protein n=1 Tax=Amnibacterium kyonggiense TaxID=595671 RepID=UPI0031E14775